MGFFSGVLVYVVLWWLVLYAVLPWSVKTETAVNTGNDPGAPQQSYIRKKILLTSAIALVFWFLVYFIIDADIEFLNKLFME